MKKLNVGLVGAGFMGKAHSIGYSDMPKYFWPAPAVPVLKTICDIVPEIAADAKERFGFEKCCTDWRDLRQQLRSKAAQPQNPQPQVPHRPCRPGNFSQQRLQIRLHEPEALLHRLGHEAAIGAAGGAEGNADV